MTYIVDTANLKSQFGELRVVERTPVIELNSAYGLSNLRDVVTTVGTGSATAAAGSGEILLSTGISANASVNLETAERGRYMPGAAGQAGIGIRIPTAPTGEQVIRWGLYASTNGYYWGMDATGMFVARLNNGTESKTYQSAWNVDPLDGSGPSGLTLSVTAGQIYHIDFTWYGYGIIEFAVIMRTEAAGQQQVLAHRIAADGSTSIRNPNLPITVEALNNATASNVDVYVGGRQYSIIGDYRPEFRVSSDYRISATVNTTTKHYVSFRRKSGFGSRSVKVDGWTIIPQTQNMILELRLNPTITSASYTALTNHTATETALESDTTSNVISGGEVLYTDIIPAGSRTSFDATTIQGLGLEIPGTQSVALCLRSTSSSGAADVVLRMREEW